VWNEFDSTIGFEYLRGMHINDDMRELGSKIDRHASLLKGTLGEAFFERLMNDPRFDNIPLILETPDDSIWAQEIEWLYSKVK
jgi:deoxyribonuclease-4